MSVLDFKPMFLYYLLIHLSFSAYPLVLPGTLVHYTSRNMDPPEVCARSFFPRGSFWWDIFQTQRVSRGHPTRVPDAPQLALMDMEEQWLYSELLLVEWAFYSISEAAFTSTGASGFNFNVQMQSEALHGALVQ